jgi:CheY-like chemotaxis protein
MLINLLSNAVKFTPEGGKVGLRVTGNPQEDSVTFTVWDTGIGIAEQDMTRLFRPFVQLDSSLTRRYTGTGLGLVLVYRMAEMHGGSVGLKSVVGQGSEFSFSLPWHRERLSVINQELSNPVDPIHEKAYIQPSDSGGGFTLLLAEDNEFNVATFSGYLHAHGFNLIIARDGQQAIEMARIHSPDLILMDVQMPVVDGLEAIRVLRTSPATAFTPIIAITALAMVGDRERCLQAGANDYFSKPVSLSSLVAAIRHQLAEYTKIS